MSSDEQRRVGVFGSSFEQWKAARAQQQVPSGSIAGLRGVLAQPPASALSPPKPDHLLGFGQGALGPLARAAELLDRRTLSICSTGLSVTRSGDRSSGMFCRH